MSINISKQKMIEVLAILVLYRCKLEESRAFNSLTCSLNKENEKMDMLVYDNSPIPQYNKKTFCKGNINIIYISDVFNSGVSKAYNTGASYARYKGKKWLLLLDQDTFFPLNAILKYREQQQSPYMLHVPILKCGKNCVSPCYYLGGYGKALKYYKLGLNSFKRISLLNSGLFISLILFRKVGGYNENIPLDFSDHYFISCVKKYIREFNVLDIQCEHSLSSSEMNMNKVLFRFEFYIKGAKEYSKYNKMLKLFVLARLVKLTIKFKSWQFVKCYLSFM